MVYHQYGSDEEMRAKIEELRQQLIIENEKRRKNYQKTGNVKLRRAYGPKEKEITKEILRMKSALSYRRKARSKKET